MPNVKMIPVLHSIVVHLKTAELVLRYEISNPRGGDLENHPTLDKAITSLRERGHNAAQVVNGPEVYVLTWGPLLAPWEGEPG